MANKPTYEELEQRVKDLEKEVLSRKQMEEEITKFKAISDQATYGFAIADMKGNITYVNEYFAKIHGYETNELFGKNLTVFHNEEQLNKVSAVNKTLIEKGSYNNEEIWHVKKDGSVFQMLMNAIVIKDENDKPLFLGATAIDITERVRAEEALRESESILSMAGRTARFGGWSAHPDGQKVVWSEQVALIHEKQPGYSPTAKEAIKYYAPEWRDKIAAVFQNCTHEGTPYDEEMEIITAGGHRLWVRTTGEAVRDNLGGIVRVQGSFQDITERKKAEEALKNNQNFLNRIIDQSPFATWISDEKGTIIKCNAALEKLLNITDEQLIDKYNVFEDEVAIEQGLIPKNRTVFEDGKTANFSVEWDANELGYKDANKVHIEGTMFPIHDEKGDLTNVVNHWIDITDRKQAEEALQESEEKLARSDKLEAMGLMAGGVAHDLNNILSGIVSYPELLLMDLPEDSPLRKPIKTIQESGMRAADVVKDLLTIARGVASGKEVLNLNTLVTEYLASAEHQNLERIHPVKTFKTELDSDLLNITGSASHVMKILMNLIANASEAIEDKGTVTVSTMNRYLDEPLKGYEDVDTGEYVMLTVSDDGSGISPTDLERIFEPFYTKKVMGRSGTGLGLAVVWNSMQDHGGYINVNTSEKGTTFELYFPTTREQIAADKEEIPLDAYIGHGEKVLVVDDEERQREIASGILIRLGYTAETVSSGEEAIEYMKENAVDLIVLDMVMPKGLNGRKTYEEIIKIRPGQKAIIASGYAKTKEVEMAQALGAGKYIMKPYTLAKVGAAVKEELEKQAVFDPQID